MVVRRAISRSGPLRSRRLIASRRLFAVDSFAAGGEWLAHLSVNALPVCRYPRIAVSHGAILLPIYAPEKRNQISSLVLVRISWDLHLSVTQRRSYTHIEVGHRGSELLEEVSIDYQLGRAGWSEFRLTVGAASVVVGPFGYCSDALGDLVRAALMIATGGWRAELSFDGEPPEWRLLIGAYWGTDPPKWTDCRLRVLTFPSCSPRAPESEGDKIFEAQCSPESFVQAVLKAAQGIWDEYGADGYDRVWGGPRGFPLRALSALKVAISVQEPRTDWAFSRADS